MKKNATYLTLLTFFSCLASIAQDLKPGTANPPDFIKLQQEFEAWSNGKDLTSEQHWKWYKRWEEFTARRVNPDGRIPDEKEYFLAATQVAKQKAQALRTTSASWFPIGPFKVPGAVSGSGLSSYGIGRINTIAFHPTDPNTFWVGVAQGGVWKTTNGGSSYMPLTDNLPILRISDICVDPQRPDTMYISVCDYAYIGVSLAADGRKRNTHYGMGVFKTTDGGITWNPTGLAFNQTSFDGSLIRRTFISSTDPNTLVAAGTTGIWKSANGGASWTKTLDSLIWDIERDPVNKNILYASGGYVSKINDGTACILKSTDFGNSWTLLNTGIPGKGTVQRVELAISPSNPSYVYALCCNMSSGFYGLYRTTNGGTNWSQRSTTPNILSSNGSGSGGQGTYDLSIIVNPSDPNTIYTAGLVVYGSTDGGQTMTQVTEYYTIHPDQHFFANNPLNQKYYLCNDGGLYETGQIVLDLTSTQWNRISDGMQIPSYYRVSTSAGNANYLIAGAQDNGSVYYNGTDWVFVGGGDGMDGSLDNVNPNTMIISSQFGNFDKSTDGGQTSTALTITNEAGEWTTPIIRDPNNNNIVYTGFTNVHKSTNGGDTWNSISNLGGPPISAIAVAPSNSSYIYITKRVQGSTMSGAKVYRTSNGGTNWTDITAGLPGNLYPTGVAVDDNNPSVAWVTYGGFTAGMKIFKTTNGGSSWTNISGNLPNIPVNCVVQQNGSANNTVYIGCDVGVYMRDDTQSTWTLFSTNLPNVIIQDLEIHYATQSLYAATFGRGIWGIDISAGGTSVGESPLKNAAIKIYPNLNNGEFKLDAKGVNAEKATFEIIDITGRKVHLETIYFNAGNFSGYYRLNLNYGLYFAKISVPGAGSVVERFVVE